MRVIEKQMIQAIMNGKNWQKDNTAVFINTEGDAVVFLHGHPIATVKDCLPLELNVDVDTLRNWPTNTTKSRLRALGANVYTKKGVIYLDDEALS